MENYIGLCELCNLPDPCNQCLGLLPPREKRKVYVPTKNKTNKQLLKQQKTYIELKGNT